MREWIILVYKVPAEPSRLRAGIWRKLKAAGAIYLQNGVAALPASRVSERVLRGVAQEALEMDGTAYLFQGRVLGDVAVLERAFKAARDEEYTEVLDRCRDFHSELAKERGAANLTFAELEENEEDLTKLEAWLRKICDRDPFGAPLRSEAGKALAACRDDLETFAVAVYAAVDHGSASSADAGRDTRSELGSAETGP